MAGTEYPKIDTLYDRDSGKFVIVGKLRRPEFENIKRWSITEKLHGRNTRISLYDNGEVCYGGKTDEAEMSPELLEYLKKTFPPEKLKAALWLPNKPIPKQATIYGEAYGAGMVPGSGLYRKDISFRLFDCLIDIYWLERNNLEDVAKKLGIKCVPILGTIDFLPTSVSDIEYLLDNNKKNLVAVEEGGSVSVRSEGIVAKSEPMLFYRKGEKIERVMWKLKIKDFKKEEPVKFKWKWQVIENRVEWRFVRKDDENIVIGSVIATEEMDGWKVVAECEKIKYKEIQERVEKGFLKIMITNMKNLIQKEVEKIETYIDKHKK